LEVVGPSADQRLIAFVPGDLLVEVMASLAELFRLSWVRGGSDEHPSYRLEKAGAAAREETTARQMQLRAALDRAIARTQHPDKDFTRANPETREYAALAGAVAPVIAPHLPELERDGAVYLPIRELSAGDQARIASSLQPVLDRFQELQRTSQELIVAQLRQQGKDVPAKLLEPLGPAPNASDGTLAGELSLQDGLSVWIGQRNNAGVTFAILEDHPASQDSAEFYPGRELRPHATARVGSAPAVTTPTRPDTEQDRFGLPVGGPAEPRPRTWSEALRRLSDRTGISIYSDDFAEPLIHPTRQRAALDFQPRRSVAESLDGLCAGFLRGETSRFWWRQGRTAFVRDNHWLWRSLTTLPTELEERLETLNRNHAPLPPEMLGQLARLTLPQVQPFFMAPGLLNCWRLAIQIPARLSPRARAAALNGGIRGESLSAEDQRLLAALGCDPRSFGLNLQASWAYVPFTRRPGLDLNIQVQTSSVKIQTTARIPVNDSSDGALTVLTRRRGPLPSGTIRPAVCALFYPWYGTPEKSGAFHHLEGVSVAEHHIGNFAAYPQAGPYDSGDEATISRQLDELKKAGVDVLVCSWWGPGSFEDRAFRKVLSRAQERGLKVCLYLEPYPAWNEAKEAKGVARELGKALRVVQDEPAYWKVGGRPVVFLVGAVKARLGLEGWSDALEELRRAEHLDPLVIAPGTETADAIVFDGVYSPSVFPEGGRSLAELVTAEQEPIGAARAENAIAVCPIGPGLDLRPGLGPKASVVPREEGALFRRYWQAVGITRPDWVLLDSYNHWETGTQTEPSWEEGDRYLKIIGEQAAAFKSAPR
jgi:hypothetical protein